MAKHYQVFAGFQTRATFSRLETFTYEGSAYPPSLAVFPDSPSANDIFMASTGIPRNKLDGTPYLNKGDFAIYRDSQWSRLNALVAFQPATKIDVPNYPVIEIGEFAFAWEGQWFNAFDRKVFPKQFIYLTEVDEAVYGYKYMLEFVVGSMTGVDLNVTMNTDSYDVHGEDFSRNSKTTKAATGSINAKLDLGSNPSQKLMYKNMFEAENVLINIYQLFYTEDGEILLDKCTRQYGEGFITSFNTSMTPTTAADLTMDFVFDGAVKFQHGNDIIGE